MHNLGNGESLQPRRPQAIVALADGGRDGKVARALEILGLGALPVTTGAELLQLLEARPADLALIVLDLGVPFISGLELCRKARERSNAAMLIYGDTPTQEQLAGALDLGADGWIPATIQPDLIASIMRATLRRAGVTLPQAAHIIKVRDLVIDLARYEVTVKGRPAGLTPTEFRLLSYLAQHSGQVLSPRRLLEEVQGYTCSDQEAQDIVKVHIRRLRSKIETDASAPSYIVNVRGFGYMLERRASPRGEPAPSEPEPTEITTPV